MDLDLNINNIDETLQNPPKSEENPEKTLQNTPNLEGLLPVLNFPYCPHCKKHFSRKDKLKRHVDDKRCKYLKNNLNNTDEKYTKLYNEHQKTQEELNNLKNIILPLKNLKNQNEKISHAVIQHNTIQNNNTQNNIVINNYIVNYGSEDISKLTSDENNQIINSNSEAIYNIIKHIHYNPRLPEYNNVYINNLRSNSVYVMVDGKFILEDKKTIISDMISRMALNIEYISSQTKPISKKQRQLLHDNFNWLKHFDFTDEDFDGNIIKSDKDLIEKYKKIYSKYELLLYNNRHMITNKNQKNQSVNNGFIDIMDV
jgi:hypothetical protein